MKVRPAIGYPENSYYVDHGQLREVWQWLEKNDVRFLHQASTPIGHVINIRSRLEWFLLRWT